MKNVANCLTYCLMTLLLLLVMDVAQAVDDEPAYSFKVNGVDKLLTENILIFLHNLTLSCDFSPAMKAAVREKIPEQVQLAVQPFGYYQSEVNTIEFKNNDTCWQGIIQVDSGPPTRIRRLKINIQGEGQDHSQLKDIEINDFLKKDAVFIDSNYQNLKQKFRLWANNYGFLNAEFKTHKVDVFASQNAVDIELDFDTGARFRIADVLIDQESEFLLPLFLKRLVGIETGSYLNNRTLIELRKRLVASEYFGSVSVTLGEKNNEKHTVPIKVKVTPGYRIDYSVGLGFTTDTGPRATFEYQHHRLNDRGYQLATKLQLAQVNSEFSARMKFPAFSNPDEKWYQTELGYRQENNDAFEANTTKIGISQTRLHSDKWQNVNFIDVLKEDFDIGGERSSTQLLVPGTAWTYQNVDDPLNPRLGFKAQMDFKIAAESLLSDMSMLQLGGRIKAILPIASDDRLILRAEIGTTVTSDFEQLPASYRYFAGGDQSIRGFDYKGLSPQDEDGDLIGGKHLALASIEYEYRLNDSYALAVFTDGGNAFTDKFKAAGSVGVGFRWFSPIGPLRVDLGVPVTESENSFRIHLSLGPDL